jgi:hypothetical protein
MIADVEEGIHVRKGHSLKAEATRDPLQALSDYNKEQ